MVAVRLPFNPELGLFNIYGDIRCQPGPDFNDYPAIELPGRWASLTLDQMVAALRAYGVAASRQILGSGAHVNIWILAMKSSWASPALPAGKIGIKRRMR